MCTMKIYKVTISFICILAIAFFFTGCKKATKNGKNIICFVDFSDSKNTSSRLDFYKEVIHKSILINLNMYDRLIILPIDKSSVTNSTEIFFVDMSKKSFYPEMASPLEEEKIVKENIKRELDSLSVVFSRNFDLAKQGRVSPSLGTDIFGALEVGKREIVSGEDNVIVLLSDMMNWSEELKMEPQNNTFNDKTWEQLLTKVTQVKLEDSKIVVITGEVVDASPEHYKLIQKFWSKYFEVNNAILYDYNSASTSKLNELMALPVNE